MFKKIAGKTKIMYFGKDTTDQIRDGSIVTFNLDSGQVVRVGNDSDDKILGVARRNDTLSDSGGTGGVPVEVAVESAVEYEVETDSDGGAADSDRGRIVNIDTTGGNSVNAGDSAGMRVDISDSAAGSFLITRVISVTRVRGVIVNTVFHQTFDT